ncbi:integral membrane protein [Fictibacillus macauensis ZFHKF-1]|uniref:Integral membrane protein n=1 Tax=Fictibacillus macauensis ZFHKF-1 TaxID=1196324 RepID=I8UKI8_9BACL|nr:aromatic acid exporter family protein [Fictibacillus macauensis]EIT87395.1 integral membrane protein [Fictibacillus macauensis ZFHKF-1]
MEKGIAILIRLGLTLQVIKTAIAGAISWELSSMLSENHYPFFAPLAAVLTMQVTIAGSVQKGFYRISGVIGGVIISMLIGHFLSLNAGSIMLVVLIGMAVSTAFKLPAQVTSQVAVSSILVLAFGQGYALSRIGETMIGSIIAVIVNALLVPPNTIPAAEELCLKLANQATLTLKDLTQLWNSTLPERRHIQEEVRELTDQNEAGIEAVALARQNLRYTPFFTKRRVRLAHLETGMKHLNHITLQIRGIARGIRDLKNTLHFNESNGEIEMLNQAIEETAQCVLQYGETVIHPTTEHLLTLIESIKSAQKVQAHCLTLLKKYESLTILRDVGAILTDLNRILKETGGETIVRTGRVY